MRITKPLIVAAPFVMAYAYHKNRSLRTDFETVCKTSAAALSTMLSYKKTLGAIALAGVVLLAAATYLNRKQPTPTASSANPQDGEELKVQYQRFITNVFTEADFRKRIQNSEQFIYSDETRTLKINLNEEGNSPFLLLTLDGKVAFILGGQEIFKMMASTFSESRVTWNSRSLEFTHQDQKYTLPPLPIMEL